MRFNWYAVPPLVGFLLLAGLVVMVRRRGRLEETHRAFVLLTAALALWKVDVLLLALVTDHTVALLVDRLFQPVLAAIPPLMVNFIAVFLRAPRRRLLTVFGVWSAVLACLAPTPLLIREMRMLEFGHYGLAGAGYILFVAEHAAAVGLVSVMLLAARRRTADPVRRTQIDWLLAATLVLGILSADNFLPLYGGESYPLGSGAVVLYTAIVAWAITRHRFLEVPALIRTSLIYSVATLLLSLLYLLLIFVADRLLRPYTDTRSFFVPLVPALVVAVMFHGVKERVQARLDRFFGRDGHPTLVLSRFAARARGAADREALVRRYGEAVRAVLCPAWFALLTVTREGKWRLEFQEGMTGEERAALAGFLDGPDGMGALATDVPEVGGWSPARRIRMAVALSGREGCLGHCLLGPPADPRDYGAPDRAFLEALSGQLAAAVEALEYHDRWKKHERFVSLGRATATIAHEIRNPLNVIQGAVACLKTRRDDGGRMAEVIGAEVRRASQFIDRLLNASRRPEVHPRRIDLAAWCREYAGRWTAGRPGHPVRCGTSGGAVWAEVDPGLLEQLLGNLCRNAAEAMGDGGTIDLAVSPAVSSVEIRVADHGPGIPPHLRDLVFDPFFTTKAKGAGLGLCVAEGAARAHGGSISVESPPAGGASFRVVLPLAPPRPVPAGANSPSGKENRHGA